MITPNEIFALSAADMNDSAQVNYTNAAMLPYLNMSLEELVQRMEESNIPITNSIPGTPISVVAGQTEIKFEDTTYTGVLPFDLVEPEMLWESNDGGESWTPMTKVEMIDPNLSNNQNLNVFGVFEWNGDRITVPEAVSDISIKMRYIRKLIPTPITSAQYNLRLPTNAKLFLAHKTAALCATFIAQDELRAGALNELAEQAIEREMNIPTKGRQTIATRRRPFRSNFKAFGNW